MAVHIEKGKQGEEWALGYLQQNGFTLVYQNWRYSRFEIDIIAEKNGVLHFVEVKLRSAFNKILPEENVTRKKIRNIMKAADFFLHRHPQYKHIQLDILSITINRNGEPEFFFIQDIYL